MKNKFFLLTALTVVATLAGCQNKGGSSALSSVIDNSSDFNSSSSETIKVEPISTDIYFPTQESSRDIPGDSVYAADKLLLNHRLVGVGIDEEVPLKGLKQVGNSGENLSFTSADPAIATVNENGLIKGIKKGVTSIEVADKDNPDLKKSVPVYVGEKMSTRPRERLLTALGEVDETKLTEVAEHELYERTVYKNGKLYRYDCADEHLIASYDDAYFSVSGDEAEIKAEEGSLDFSKFAWIFNTNDYYDTYIYHQIGDFKNYLPISTVDYMGEKRYVPMLDVIDNIFVAGRKIFTNIFATDAISAKMTRMLYFANGSMTDSSEFYSFEDNSLLYNCTMALSASGNTADLDDESNYGIPYGTPMPGIQKLRFVVKNKQLLSCAIYVEETYKIGDDQFKEILEIDYTFDRITNDNRDSFIIIPDTKEYTRVDSVFDV